MPQIKIKVNPQANKLIFSFLVALSLFALVLSLSLGSVSIDIPTIWDSLTNQQTNVQTQIITELRFPRAATAFLTGGLLALSGVLMQVLLRNPLADPYILGISGGAAVGALLSITLGIASQWIDIAAFIGAMLSMLVLFILSKSNSSQSTDHLLLTGVVIAAGWGATINLLLIMADTQSIHSMLFWLMGDLTSVSMPSPLVPIILISALSISWYFARDLNLLSQGEDKAQALGSPVKRVRQIAFVTAALCTAIAVSMAGSIGFVGLIIPHLLRLIIGSNHRLLLPASVLAGGSLLTLADLGARTLFAPQQLPVGVITAIIGVPVFLYLLKRQP